MTKASLTEMHAMVSTPFALNLSASATNPGTCFAEQVGVNPPGNAKTTTFLPGAKSSSVVTALGPSGPIVRSVALGTLSPTLIILPPLAIGPADPRTQPAFCPLGAGCGGGGLDL